MRFRIEFGGLDVCLGEFKVRIRDKNGGFLLGSKGRAAAWSWEGQGPCWLICAEEGRRAAAWPL